MNRSLLCLRAVLFYDAFVSSAGLEMTTHSFQIEKERDSWRGCRRLLTEVVVTDRKEERHSESLTSRVLLKSQPWLAMARGWVMGQK